jgi:hypothetical protein
MLAPNVHPPLQPNSARTDNIVAVGGTRQHSSSSAMKPPQRTVASSIPQQQSAHNSQASDASRNVPHVHTNLTTHSQAKQPALPSSANHNTTLNLVSSGADTRPSHMDITRYASHSAQHVNSGLNQERPKSVRSRDSFQASNARQQAPHGSNTATCIPGNQYGGPSVTHNSKSEQQRQHQEQHQQYNATRATPPKTSGELLLGSSLFQESQPLPPRPSTSSGRKSSSNDSRRTSIGDGKHIQAVPQVTPVSINGKRPPLSNVHDIDPTHSKKQSVNPYAIRHA